MATKKNKFVTPKGVLVFPRLNLPDTKFNEHGTFSADLRVPVEEAKPLMQQIAKLFKEHTGSAHPKFPPRKDRDAVWYFDQDEDGDFDKEFVIFKLRAKNIKKKDGELWVRRPKVFDAAGSPIKLVNRAGKLLDTAPRIGGGTVAKVSFEADCYSGKATGVRLIPQAVQIIDLIEYGDGGSAEDYGFGEGGRLHHRNPRRREPVRRRRRR